MPRLPDLSARALLAERMDDPDCDTGTLLRTVRQFDLINRLVSRHRTLLNRWVLAEMRRGPSQPWRLADLGAGGCDIPVWLLDRARRLGLRLEIEAWERDRRIANWAASTYGERTGLIIRADDALTAPLGAPVDYLFANHFLHHLTDDEIVALLQRWAPHVRRLMLFSDLARQPSSYVAFDLLSRLLRRDTFNREDGLLSIRRGFRAAELMGLAARAGLADSARVDTLFPGRIVLMIRRPHRANASNDGTM